MDEYVARRTLAALYKLENRSVKLGTEADYVERHIKHIIEMCGGVWVDQVASKYIDDLRSSI